MNNAYVAVGFSFFFIIAFLDWADTVFDQEEKPTGNPGSVIVPHRSPSWAPVPQYGSSKITVSVCMGKSTILKFVGNAK